MSFAPNRGQFAPDVRFASKGAGYALAATDRGLELAIGGARVPVRFAGARPTRPRAGAALPGKANYLLGDDPRRWRTNVPTYREVVYGQPWPGIDVALYGSQGRFEYDLRVAPGADPAAARLDFGHDARIARDGSLHVGGLRQLPPRAYQGDREIASGYAINEDGTVGFRLGRYDHNAPLVIDPVLAYSTYLGGNGTDYAQAIAVDGAGSAYVTGQTQSTDFAAGTLAGVSDAFVAKLTPAGEVAWTTYLGGGTDEQGNGIAVTGDGEVVTGWTTSANFPTKTPLQGSRNGFRDAFVTKLTPAGTLAWSTYLGGSDADDGNAVAVDPAGGVYLAGTTHSDNFPGTPAGSAAGGDDAFAAKVTGTTLAYATYLGGDGNDLGTAIAADAAGNAYVAGRAGDNFPSTLPYGGGGDAFAARLGPTGARAYSTYLGGTTSDEAAGIAVTGAGVAVVVGTTQSPDFPHTTGALRGPSDAFVTRVTATGATDASFFFGGSADEVGSAVAIEDGHVVIAGRTQSGDFPTVNPAQGTKGAGLDAFVTQLDGTTPLMSTYLGGSSGDEAHGVALDPGGNAYVAGRTEGSFPAGGTNPAGIDGFVAKLAIGSSSGPAPIVTPPPIPPAPQPAAPTPETTITARPPAQTPDQVVQFRFSGRMPGQIDPASGISFGCRLDGGDFKPCTSPYTTAKLALAEHTFAVRAINASGVADPSPATFTFRVAQPRPEVRHYSCDLKPTGAYHDRGTRDWGPCDMPEIVCPREAVCLLDLAVDEHDDSYLFNYDVHLLRLEEGAYKDRVFCFAPPLSTPVNPKLEVRFDPRRGEHNRHHSCHADGALGLVDTSKDVRIRYRCSGSGHAPKPGGDRTTGEGHEDNAHLGCDITATIQRHVTELGDALVDGASPNLLVYTPQPGSVTVSGAKLATVTIKAAGGAVRVPLRLNAAAKKLRRKKALSAKLAITFKPADGATLTHTATVKLKRAAARRPARTRGAARRSAARSR